MTEATQDPTTKRSRKAAATPTGQERVQLESGHTHGGVAHAAGDWIIVPADTAQWLRDRGVIAKADVAATAETTPTTATED